VGTFKAIRIDKAEKGTTAALTQFDEAELMEGDVTVRVEWSTLNYKDGLAVTGRAPVVRRFPMIAGIDFAGAVEQSQHPQWKAGDKVICNGWGMGETHLGAYAEKARVKGDWLVRLPDNISTREAMAIGTAGYTAMLSVLALEKHGLTPKSGPVVVTGAAGGVGSVAIAVLSKLGYHAIASTGRMSVAEFKRDKPAEYDELVALSSDALVHRDIPDFIVGARRIIDDVVPPDRLGKGFAIEWRKIFDARERSVAVLNVREVVIVAAGRVVSGNQLFAVHGSAPTRLIGSRRAD